MISNKTYTAVIALVVLSVMGAPVVGGMSAAATGPDINYDNDKASPAYIHSNAETIAVHDRSDMSSYLEVYDDQGEVVKLPAHYNASQDEPITVRYDKIEDSAFELFPRVSGESNNGQSWLGTGNWTKNGQNSTQLTISDADGSTASGVPAVQISTSSMESATTDVAAANFSQHVDITSDATKRVAFMVVNVNSIEAGADVEWRMYDSDGDYRSAHINTSGNSADDAHIANSTGNGYVFQTKIANLPATTNGGDGTFGAINYTEIVVEDGDADVTITAMDLEKKSKYDFGQTHRDTDGDGDEDTKVDLEDINGNFDSGYVELTDLSTMGSWADDSRIHDLKVHDVRYSEEDLESSDDWDVEFSNATNYSYNSQVEKFVRLTVPSLIDVSHGTLELRMHQGHVNDRYAVVEVAESTGDTVFKNLSDSDYTSKSSSFTDRGGEITLDASITAGDNYVVHSLILLQQGEVDSLKGASGGGAGPLGQPGGGFFGSIWGTIVGALGAVASFFGLKKFLG